MNNHKIVLKTSIFKWLQILLCVAPLFVQSSARLLTKREVLDSMGPYSTPYNKLKFHTFDDKRNNFESEILKSLQTTKNIFATKQAQFIVSAIGVAASFNPFTSAAAGVLSILNSLLAHESDWTKTFSKTLRNQLDRRDVFNKVDDLAIRLQSLNDKRLLMTEKNRNRGSREKHASDFHSAINIMLNHFDKTNSIFKLYPLIGAPLLLTLAQLIAFYEPTLKELNPLEGINPELSCKVRNIVLDYRPRTIVARLEQLLLSSYYVEGTVYNSHKTFAELVDEVMSYKYVDRNITNIRCERRCDKLKYLSKLNNLDFSEETGPAPSVYHGFCLADKFSEDYVSGNSDYSGGFECIKDYVLLVKDRVEELFSVDFLNEHCDNPPETTGFGYLTMTFNHVNAIGGPADLSCDPFTQCDPYLMFFIDDEPLWKTEYVKDNCCFDVGLMYISANISKSSRIKIQMWDSDEGDLLGPEPDWFFTTEDTIEKFLKKGHRSGGYLDQGNYINTVSFWQDIYKDDIENKKMRKTKKRKIKKSQSKKDKLKQ